MSWARGTRGWLPRTVCIGRTIQTKFVGRDGKVTTYQPLNPDMLNRLPEISLFAKLDVGAAVLALDAMSTVVNAEAPWEDVELPFTGTVGPKTSRDADTMSLQTWMDLNLSTEEAKVLLGNAYTGILGVSPASASLLHLLFMFKTFQGKFMNTIGSGPGEAEEFRVRGGAQEMAKRIAAELRDKLHLNSPVRQITQRGKTVTVRSETVSVRAGRVIVATGTAMANFIRFDPILPSARALLQQRMPQGEVWKIWLCYDTAFWRNEKDGLNGESVTIAPGSRRRSSSPLCSRRTRSPTPTSNGTGPRTNSPEETTPPCPARASSPAAASVPPSASPSNASTGPASTERRSPTPPSAAPRSQERERRKR